MVEQSDNESHDVYLVSDYRANQWDQPNDIVAAIERGWKKRARA